MGNQSLGTLGYGQCHDALGREPNRDRQRAGHSVSDFFSSKCATGIEGMDRDYGICEAGEGFLVCVRGFHVPGSGNPSCRY